MYFCALVDVWRIVRAYVPFCVSDHHTHTKALRHSMAKGARSNTKLDPDMLMPCAAIERDKAKVLPMLALALSHIES